LSNSCLRISEPTLPIYVISFAGSSVRQKSIQDQAEILGLKFEFFDAIDGRNGFSKAQEPCFDRKKAKKNINRDISDTEIGCAMSHALLCKKISETDHPDGAIILEDDVSLPFDFAELLAGNKLETSQENMIMFTHSHAYTYPIPVAPFSNDIVCICLCILRIPP